MNKFFYPKMAATNIFKNSRFYVPFYLSAILCVTLFFNITSLATGTLPGGETIAITLRLGVIVVGLFSVIFLFYTNSFLIKRRKKELGLYNILGMGKRHIALVMIWETLYSFIISIVLGLGLGALLDKLMHLMLVDAMKLDSDRVFSLPTEAFLITAVLFTAIFFLMLLHNLRQIVVSNPIELLQGGSVGEKEPKTNWVIAVIGLVCLGGGYFIALWVDNIVTAIMLFFVAVILVIIGTYCLFTAGSVAILKILRKNKRFYYKPNHFVPVSGMIYRMKQHAVGLGNICILSTMVLVMLSTTISMYAGVQDIIDTRNPYDICYSLLEGDGDIIDRAVESAKEETGLNIKDYSSYEKLVAFLGQVNDHEFTVDTNRADITYSAIVFLTPENYRAITGTDITLGDNEVAVYSLRGKVADSFELVGETYKVVQRLPEISLGGTSTASISNYYYAVANQPVFDKVMSAQMDANDMSNTVQRSIQFNVDGDDEQAKKFYDSMIEYVGKYAGEDNATLSYSVDSRQYYAEDSMSFFGSFLFLGFFLGVPFLMATVLIIYYKQLSEGYEDRRRYEIMHQIGMSQSEIKRSIKSQVLMVFFIPLGMAIIHILFAFPILTQILYAFCITNITLFRWCTIGCVAVYAIIYAIVYAVTAKVYYKIVS